MKDGQIAHVDHDSSNAAIDNLVYLCLEHHKEYDAKSYQAKAVTEEEVRRARADLLKEFDGAFPLQVSITLRLHRDSTDLTTEDTERVLNALKAISHPGAKIVLTATAGDSVLLTFKVEADDARRIMAAVEAGDLEQFDVVDAWVVDVSDELNPDIDENPLAEGTTSRERLPPASLSAVSVSDVLNPVSVDQDWQFLWSLLGDRAFCEKYWNQYVAVFMREVVGSGPTDPEARDAAARTLSQRGTRDVPPERFVVDFVGDA